MENLEIGGVSELDEIQTCLSLMQQAFNFPVPQTFVTAAEAGLVDPRVARLDGEIVGMVDLLLMGQWFGGRSVPMGGLRAVAVKPEVRGKGVASRLVRSSLESFHAAGFPLSTLFPATLPVYRRAGYELAGHRLIYRMPLAGLDLREKDVELVPLGEQDRAHLVELYRTRAALSAGNLNRTPWFWERVLRAPGEEVYSYLLVRKDRPEGYVSYTQKAEGPRGYTIHVRDMVAVTPHAARALWAFFAAHRSMANHVSWVGGPSEPLALVLPEQPIEIQRRQAWMLRIVDVAAALAARGYSPELTAELQLEVKDELLPWNNGKFVLEVAGGHGRVQPGGKGQLKLDVRGLASLYAGYATPEELAIAGLLSGNAAALATARTLFAGPTPWMPDFF